MRKLQVRRKSVRYSVLLQGAKSMFKTCQRLQPIPTQDTMFMYTVLEKYQLKADS